MPVDGADTLAPAVNRAFGGSKHRQPHFRGRGDRRSRGRRRGGLCLRGPVGDHARRRGDGVITMEDLDGFSEDVIACVEHCLKWSDVR